MWITPELSRVCPRTLNIPSRFSISGGFNSGTMKKATSANLSYGKHTHTHIYIYIYLSIAQVANFHTWDAHLFPNPSAMAKLHQVHWGSPPTRLWRWGASAPTSVPVARRWCPTRGRRACRRRWCLEPGKPMAQWPYSTRNVGAMNYPQLQVDDDSIWFNMI